MKSKNLSTLSLRCLISILFFAACQHPGDTLTSQKDNSTNSNSFALKWSKAFGGNDDDESRSILTTEDGGLLIAGTSYSNSSGDVSSFQSARAPWLFKIDSTGKILWSRTYAGFFSSVIKTKDGGYLAVGFSNDSFGMGTIIGNHGNSDVLVVKLNGEGALQWQKLLGGTNYEVANAAVEASDGSFVLAGFTNSSDGDLAGQQLRGLADAWVGKISSTGDLVWQYTFGGSAGDNFNSIAASNDGGFIMAGHTLSTDGQVTESHNAAGGIYGDFWVVKINSEGRLTWQKALGGSGDEYPNTIIQGSDGIYVAGRAGSDDGDVSGKHGGAVDGWVIKLNATGNLIWQHMYGGTGEEDFLSMVQMEEGNLAAIGFSSSTDGDVSGNHGNADVWVAKIKNDGKILVQKSLGGTQYDTGNNLCRSSEGNIYVVGTVYSKDGDISTNHSYNDIWVAHLK